MWKFVGSETWKRTQRNERLDTGTELVQGEGVDILKWTHTDGSRLMYVSDGQPTTLSLSPDMDIIIEYDLRDVVRDSAIGTMLTNTHAVRAVATGGVGGDPWEFLRLWT